MSTLVLKSKAQIERARADMEQRGISCVGMEVGRPGVLRRLIGKRPSSLGDTVKSWDVQLTADFVDRQFPKTARILDIGAYNSEILCVLHRLGFRNLTGLDLNPAIRAMPFSGEIRYEVGDFLRAPFPDASFDAITSISVIEHGLQPARLLEEMSRLLAPNGCFIASFDYWPEKVDTTGVRFFDMEWCIFSSDEVRSFVEKAAGYGFAPEGPLALDAGEPTVRYADRDYTFAWMALRKRGHGER